jgi:1,4-alpha-glucan branching enzyme
MIKHQGNSVEFKYWKPQVDNLAVAGSFNNWNPIHLEQDKGNYWVGAIELPIGEYEFRYVSETSNGKEWYTDFAADGVRKNNSDLNSILRVVEGE